MRLMLRLFGIRQYLRGWEHLARRTLEHRRREGTYHTTNPELAYLEVELAANPGVCESRPAPDEETERVFQRAGCGE